MCLLLQFQQQAQLSYHIVLPFPNQRQPKTENCFPSLISELLTDTRELAPTSLLGLSAPSAATALPHTRQIPGKAGTSFLTKSPLHLKSERTDCNFPKKVTVRMCFQDADPVLFIL